MKQEGINRKNVGRIAERIVSNELEFRGFRVSDLNKEGLSANADLIAAKDGHTWQIQVKGATEVDGPWVNYGFCNEGIIDKVRPMYNAASTFYKAQVVVLVSVKNLKEYSCVVLPVEKAEEAAQICLEHSFRLPNRDGSKKKAGPVWASLKHTVRPRDLSRIPLLKIEQEMLTQYIDNWDIEKTAAASQ